jgi:uncharacterized protein
VRDFRDAKAMAQTLRETLKARSVSVTHSESLELIAKILGFHDWNVLSAQIQAGQRPADPQPRRHPVADSATLPTARSGGPGLPTIPLRDIVLFPRMTVPLYVGREATRRAVECALAGDRRVLAVTQRRASDDNPAPDSLYGVGVVANIIHLTTLADGNIRLFVESMERMAVSRLAEGPFLMADVASVEESRSQGTEALSLMRPVLEKFQVYRNASLSTQPYVQLQHIREPGVLADTIAALLSAEIGEKQDLLETGDVVTRLEKIFALMETDRQPA